MNFKKSSTELYQKAEELKMIRANEIIRRLTDKMANSNIKINDLEKNNEDYNKEIEDLKTTNDTIRAAKEAAVEDKRDLESKVKEIQDQLHETKKIAYCFCKWKIYGTQFEIGFDCQTPRRD